MTKKSKLLSIILLFKKWHMYMYISITMLTKYSALKGIWAGPHAMKVPKTLITAKA